MESTSKKVRKVVKDLVEYYQSGDDERSPSPDFGDSLKDGLQEGDEELFYGEPWPYVKKRLGYLTPRHFLNWNCERTKEVIADMKDRKIHCVMDLLNYLEEHFGEGEEDPVKRWLIIFDKLVLVRQALNEVASEAHEEWALRVMRIRKKIERMPGMDSSHRPDYLIIDSDFHPNDAFLIEALATAIGIVVQPIDEQC